MPLKLTVDYINKIIGLENYICSAYDVGSKKFKYICSKGHEGSMRMDHWHRGVRCATCAGNKKLSFSYIKDNISAAGYTVLSSNYVNNNSPLHVKCPKDHEYFVSWCNWHTGYRCPFCAGVAKNTVENVCSSFKHEGYTLLTDHYTSNKAKLDCICPNGHEYQVSWDNWHTNNSRCPRCSLIGMSKQEQLLVTIIEELCSAKILLNVRNVIFPYELDIFIPEYNVAIEYCGLYWHSELMGKGKKYHVEKTNLCVKKGIKLITIFEDELITKPFIVKSRLATLLSGGSNNIFARKCIIQPITAKQARIFCEENHLQGYGAGASVKLGLFYAEELVAVMTFSKPSIAKGQKNPTDGTWELHRFCSKINTRVIGGASKLLKYFERNYTWEEIFSYADRRWSTGDLYKILGFDYLYLTEPNYWYFKNNKERIHRYNLRKPKDCSNTELNLRLSQGYNRIWDCGNLKYIKYCNMTN